LVTTGLNIKTASVTMLWQNQILSIHRYKEDSSSADPLLKTPLLDNRLAGMKQEEEQELEQKRKRRQEPELQV
jgi:hypothetical protein